MATLLVVIGIASMAGGVVCFFAPYYLQNNKAYVKKHAPSHPGALLTPQIEALHRKWTNAGYFCAALLVICVVALIFAE